MLGWVWKKGKSRLKTLYELPQDSLYIPQQDSTRVPICLKATSDLEKKLGVYTCPTGDFSYHVAHILTTGSEYVERLGTQRLPARDAWMGTHYQLPPKLIYGLLQLLNHHRNWKMHSNLSGSSSYPPVVSI
jgi:hypothetical protein